MFDEPDQRRDDTASDPKKRLDEKLAELRMLAELAAIFEGPRKFRSKLLPTLAIEHAREIQRAVAVLERRKKPGVPILPPDEWTDAEALLKRIAELLPSPGDYHLHRRPGEVMLVRWLDEQQAGSFYERMQAHFDTMLQQVREDERQALGWKQDPAMQRYLDALETASSRMEDYYLRMPIRSGAWALSTISTDDMNILFLADQLMGVEPSALVGTAAAPADPFDEEQLGWYMRLFSLRGLVQKSERVLFFVFLQRSESEPDLDFES